MDTDDRWLNAVRSRLQRVAADQNLGPVLEPDAITEASALAGQLSPAGDHQARFLLGLLHWYRYNALPSDDDQDLLALFTAVEMFLPCHAVGMTGLPQQLLPVLTGQRQAVAVAQKMLKRALETADQPQLAAAARLWQRIALASRPGDPDRAGHLANLGTAQLAMFRQTRDPSALDEAVEALQAAAEALPSDHADGPVANSNLGTALLERYNHSLDRADLDAAVAAGRTAVAMAARAGRPDGARYTWNLGNALYARFERAGDAADLEAAVAAGQSALAAMPPDEPARPTMAASLARRLEDVRLMSAKEADQGGSQDSPDWSAYWLDTSQRATGIAELDDAVAAAQTAMRATPAKHRDQGMQSHNLGVALLARFSGTDAQPDLDASIEALRHATEAAWPGDPRRAAMQDALGVALRYRFERNAVLADANAAIEAGMTALELTAPGNPGRPGVLSNLGNALLARYERSTSPADLEAAVAAMRGAVDAAPPEHPHRALLLTNLSNALLTSFRRGGAAADPADLAAAIEHARAAAATADRHPARPKALCNLGNALLRQFEESGAETDLDAAVDSYQAALAAVSDADPERALILSNVGGALRTRFQHARGTAEAADAIDTADLDAAIEHGRAAVEAVAADHPAQERYLSSLGATLRVWFDSVQAQAKAEVDASAVAALQLWRERSQPPTAGGADWSDLARGARECTDTYERTGLLADLRRAVTAYQAALAVAPAAEVARLQHDLGNALQSLYQRTGDTDALTDAVAAARAAVEAADARLAPYTLAALGGALRQLGEQSGDVGALAEAVTVLRAAAESAPAGGVEHAFILGSLGNALRTAYRSTGDATALAEAVRFGRAAAAAIPDEHPARGGFLSNFSGTLYDLYQRTGDTSALAEAVQAGRDAIAATPDDNPDYPRVLSNLAAALPALYQRTGEIADLTEAIAAAQSAVSGAPAGHRLRGGLMATLAVSLFELFERTGNTEALARAVGAARAAAADTPLDDAHRPGRLANLSVCLMSQFRAAGDAGALAEAAQVAREAVAAAPDGHVHRATCLSALSEVLAILAERTPDPAILAEAVDLGRLAVATAPPGHPNRAAHLVNLGSRLRAGDAAALAEAVDVLYEAARDQAATTWTRVEAWRLLGTIADERVLSARDRLAAIESAVDLLPRVASRALARSDLQHAAGRVASLAGDAAAAAVAAGLPERAVELLEQTRGLLVADALDLRSLDVDQLRQAEPELASTFEKLRDQIDVLDRRDAMDIALDSGLGDADAAQALRQLAEERRTVYTDWENLVARIRSLPRFGTFLRPPGIADLAARASGGPVVFAYVSSLRCDALVLTSDPGQRVRVVPLPALTDSDAQARYDLLARAQQRIAADGPLAAAAAREDLAGVLGWLWDVVAEPVLTELGHRTAPAEAAAWPRVWWCPVGVLAMLPLHAAGHHARPDPDSRSVLDRVISSYTTTVRAMGHSHAHSDDPAGTDPARVIIAAPDIPGIPPLPGASTEAANVAELIPGARTLGRPTRQMVLDELQEAGIAHFACHGVVDYGDPARSQLVLYDYDTAPLTAADIGSLNLTRASLAYLSACSTSVTSLTMANEALHLAGAFQLAGFRHVIATLWPVDDLAAAGLAGEFYGRLFAGDARERAMDGSATALHWAVRRRRDENPGNIVAWAGYTHTGR